MAHLEYIDFVPWHGININPELIWEQDKLSRKISKLPQIFWQSGEGWTEANHWALDKSVNQGAHIDTTAGLIKHLHDYANFLEQNELDWRHFPIRLSERAVVKFRGHLIQKINSGSLASSTARSRMNAVVQFYRHAAANNLIDVDTPMWKEHKVVLRYFDNIGFKRSLVKFSTDLAIPNRKVIGIRLEDGLLPISETHMSQLLEFTSSSETTELHLMLTLGFFTGARLGTITSLRIEDLERARPDPYMKGFYLIRIGPGTTVSTKLNVEGDLLIPNMLLEKLKQYAYSTERIKRESRADEDQKSILFLTSHGNKYSNNSVTRLMTSLRRAATNSHLKFMTKFKFHQTRATYGTWLMKLTLSVTSPAAAIAFVKEAMLHKHESTTFRYIKFLENTKGKEEAAEAFHRAFTGLSQRNWNDVNV